MYPARVALLAVMVCVDCMWLDEARPGESEASEEEEGDDDEDEDDDENDDEDEVDDEEAEDDNEDNGGIVSHAALLQPIWNARCV